MLEAGNLDLQVDSIGKRTGDAGAVLPDLVRVALAGVPLRFRAKVTARARIHGSGQQKIARKRIG
ncbi:hypothetical protein QDX86_22595, partial [Enterobacter bugandensis]